MARRVLAVLIGGAVMAAAVVLFSTRPENDALIEVPPESVVTKAETSAIDLAPPPITRSLPAAPSPASLIALTGDPFAGQDLHTLYGRVTDAHSKEPVGFFTAYSASVQDGDIEYLARDNRYAQGFNNKYGAFTFRGKQRGDYNLLVRVTGYQDQIVTGIRLPMEKGEELNIEVSRGAWIQAECIDSDGDGLGDIEVRLVPVVLDNPNEKAPRIQLRRTDDYGKVLFSNLPTGVYHVELINKALYPHPSPDYHLGPGGNFPVQFIVDTANTLTVKLEDEDGGPVASAHVRLFSKGEDKLIFRLTTERDGKAEQPFLPQGEYTYKIWKQGYYRKNGTLSITTTNEEVERTLVMRVDPTDGEQERNPTMKQLERLKAGEDAADVFGVTDGN